MEAGTEHGVDPLLEVEVQVPGLEVLEDVRHVHVRAAVEVAAGGVRVAEGLEVRDPAWTEVGLLGRSEAQEELGGVRDQIGAVHARCHRHLLRQALGPAEAAAGEPPANARRLKQAQVLEERLRALAHVVERVAAQEHGDVVRLQHGRVRVAREADRRQERELAGPAVMWGVLRPRLRHVSLEVGKAPRDRDAEPRGGRREAAVEAGERILEVALRRPEVAATDGCGHELVVQRRDDHGNAVVADDAQALQQVLLGRQPGRGRAARRGRQLVD